MTRPVSLDDRLLESARTSGHRTALEETSGRTATYSELARDSDAIADRLRARGAGAGRRIGLLAPKSIEAVAALWGVLRADAAYVPADVGSPPARSAGVFRDAGVDAIVTTPDRAERLGARVVADLLGGRRGELVIAEPAAVGSSPSGGTDSRPGRSSRLAYVLYTSGSTGSPKGVAHSHSSALAFVDWARDRFGLREDDRIASLAPFHFDLSTFDLFATAAAGACLVLFEETLVRSPRHLSVAVGSHEISALYATPTLLRLILERVPVVTDGPRLVLFAGEVFPAAPLERARARWKRARWFNLYGPTETNVCTAFELPADRSFDEPPPIGRACPYARLRIVNAEGEDVAPGETGELWVCGESVMEGYWGHADDDERVFARDPRGQIWYRTGDQVSARRDGEIVFVGRNDRMVKRRGHRVELGEIEARLHDHPTIADVAVVAIPDESDGVRLVAYCRSAGSLSPLDLRSHCAGTLPSYMIPDRFVSVDDLPRTANDKIDYRRLAALA